MDLGLLKRTDPYTRGGVLESDVRIRNREIETETLLFAPISLSYIGID